MGEVRSLIKEIPSNPINSVTVLMKFDSLPLDDRLRKALAHLGWQDLTPVQAKAIPLALRGKDVLARARTGSGKTGAYALPILQKILSAEIIDKSKTAIKRKGPRAVVLVPTRELVEQVRQVFASLTHFAPSVTIAALTADQALSAQKALLAENPHILVATPARLQQHLQENNVRLRESVETVVFDEADLLLSYGYEDDIKSISGHLPNVCQSILMSATLSEDVERLQSLVMHNPVVLKLDGDGTGAGGAGDGAGQLAQFSLRCSENDKFLISYVLLKLGILTGKTLFFVNDIERCYQLKLFLEQFSVKSAVLNAELPQNSRTDIIHAFNRGVFTYLIATDDSIAAPAGGGGGGSGGGAASRAGRGAGGGGGGTGSGGGGKGGKGGKGAGSHGRGGEDSGDDSEGLLDEDEAAEPAAPAGSSSGGGAAAGGDAGGDGDDDEEAGEEEEGGAQEGVEDKRLKLQREALAAGVASAGGGKKQGGKAGGTGAVRKAVKAAGAARDGEYGAARGVDFKGVETVVNFDVPATLRAYTHRIGRTARGGAAGTALTLVGPQEAGRLAGLVARQTMRAATGKGPPPVQPLPFNLAQVEGFRYRAEDSLRRVSRLAVKRARLLELQHELMNAEALKSHFSENPQDLQALRHDRVLAPAKVQPHLAKVPAYLLPPAMRTRLVQDQRQAKRAAAGCYTPRGGGAGAKRRRPGAGGDPLQTFEYSAGGDGGGGGGGGGQASAAGPVADGGVGGGDDGGEWHRGGESLKAKYQRKKEQSRRKKKDKHFGRAGQIGSRAKRCRV